MLPDSPSHDCPPARLLPTEHASSTLACGSLYPVTVQVPGAGSRPKGDTYSALTEVDSVFPF